MKLKDINEFNKTVLKLSSDPRAANRWLAELHTPRKSKISVWKVEQKRVYDNNEAFESYRGRLCKRWTEKCYLGNVCIGTISIYRTGFLENNYGTDDGKRFEVFDSAVNHLLCRMENGFVFDDRSILEKAINTAKPTVSFLKGLWKSLRS